MATVEEKKLAQKLIASIVDTYKTELRDQFDNFLLNPSDLNASALLDAVESYKESRETQVQIADW